MKRSLAIGWVLALVFASTAGAQILQPPARPTRGLFGGGAPPDPNRLRQELTLGGSLLGGYEDSLLAPGGGDGLARNPSGYTGVGDASLRYWFGKEARSIELGGHGYTNTYRNAGLTPMFGATQTLRARTAVGRHTSLQLGESLRDDPYFSIGSFGSLAGLAGSENPDTNSVNRIADTRSRMATVAISLDRQWTRRTSTNVGYSYSDQSYGGSAGTKSNSHGGTIDVSRSVGRSSGFRISYRRSSNDVIEHVSAVRVQDDLADVSFTYARNLSRTRRIAFSGGAGAIHVDTVDSLASQPLRYWTPSSRGNVRLDVGRSWNLSADYQRSVSVLQGLDSQAFVSHIGLVSAGGYIGRRIESVFSAAYSNGVTGQVADGPIGQSRAYTGTAQLRFHLAAGWSSVVSVNHYEYRLNAAASQSLGVTSKLSRNVVRVGVSWSLPLFGSYLEGPTGTSGGGN